MTAITTRSQTFSLAPRNLDEAMRFAEMIAKTELVPKDYKGKPGNILVAVQYGAELGLSPMQALQSVSVINGRGTLWGDALMALVRSHKDCEWIKEGVTGEGEKAVGWCEVKRRGSAPHRVTFSVLQAKRAQLWNKPGPWQQYPERMLQLRARGFALRDTFADALRGVITTEEARDYPTIDAPAAQGMADARAAIANDPLRVQFPNGRTAVYGTKEQAWEAIATATDRCETLEQLEALCDDNAHLLEPPHGEEMPLALGDVRDAIRTMRTTLSAPDVAHDADTGEIAEPDEVTADLAARREAFARDRAAMIASAKTEDELRLAMTGDGWALLPEKWLNELHARAKIKRAQWQQEAAK